MKKNLTSRISTHRCPSPKKKFGGGGMTRNCARKWRLILVDMLKVFEKRLLKLEKLVFAKLV